MVDVGIEKLTGGISLTSIKAGVADIAIYVIWGLVILVVGLFAYKKYSDKKIYIYPVRIFRQRNNGTVKEHNTFGGYLKKGKITTFVIKVGKFKKKTLNKLPLSEFMDEDNRVYYWQISPDSPLIQVKRSFNIDQILVENENFKEPSTEEYMSAIERMKTYLKGEEEYKNNSDEELTNIARSSVDREIEEERQKLIDVTSPTYSPVPTDLQQQALLDINSYKNTLGVNVNQQFAYFIAGVIALIVLGIIIFYIAVNKGDVPIITKFFPLLFFKRKKNK